MDLLTIYGPSIALAGPQASPRPLLGARTWGWAWRRVQNKEKQKKNESQALGSCRGALVFFKTARKDKETRKREFEPCPSTTVSSLGVETFFMQAGPGFESLKRRGQQQADEPEGNGW